MATIKVGVREFRERMATLLESDTPVAVTRRGETIGIYVPTRRKSSAKSKVRKTADISELKAASNRLAEALVAGTKDFFESRTLEHLAEAQGVTSLKGLVDLAGGWPLEESLDDFLDFTRRTRR
ncbi:MAG: hypothetical protein ACRD51_03825 [Candidatus Acidiferrum sp.]